MKKIFNLLMIGILLFSFTINVSAISTQGTSNPDDQYKFEVSKDKGYLAKIKIHKTDGSQLKKNLVQVYSYFEKKDVFVGSTDDNGIVDINYLPDEKLITDNMKQNNKEILDVHYAVISSDNEEVVIDGITKSYCLKEGKLYTNKIDAINKTMKTERYKKKDTLSTEKGIVNTVSIWHLGSTKDLGNKSTKVGDINVCSGVTGSAALKYGTSYDISGGSVVSVTLTQSTSQSYALSSLTSSIGYRYDLYSIFHYVEEFWYSDAGEMQKLRADQYVGGLTKIGQADANNGIAYSTAITKPNARIMSSPGSYDKIVSNGISVASAASVTSSYSGRTYTVGLGFSSSYEKSFHMDFASNYSQYCIYNTNDNVTHN